jgi:hypothetical protein
LACCLLVSAEAAALARPAAAFALLNHMLISGFFFSQGFFIRFPFRTIYRDRFESGKLPFHVQGTLSDDTHRVYQPLSDDDVTES